MQPLLGVNVVSIASHLPGPVAVAQLAQWGASVIKVELPAGDPLALRCPHFYQHLLGNQRAVPVDLKSAAGRAELDGYLATADLLVSTNLPSSLERLNLAWNRLHADFPRLCQVAIVGYPPPELERTGHDLGYQASQGLLTPPTLPTTLIADMAGAQTAVSQSLAVLMERSRTGSGVLAHVSLASAIDFMALPLRFGLTTPGGLLGGGMPFYNLYPTQSGWLAVAALESHFWEKLQALFELPDATYEQLRDVFLTRTADDWERFGDEHRLPLAAVRACTAE